MSLHNKINIDAIVKKWNPILEHKSLPKIEDDYRKQVTAIILENQEAAMREQSVRESAGSRLFLLEDPSQSGVDAAGITNGVNNRPSDPGVAQYVDPVIISMVRRSYPKLMAYDVCGVQPMTGPTGVVYGLRTHYGDAGNQTATGSLAANTGAGFSVPNESGYHEANTAYSGQGSQDPLGTFIGNLFASTPANYGTPMSTSSGEMMDTNWLFGTGGPGTNEIKDMSISIEAIPVSVGTRKLRASNTLEMAQDLKAIHGLNTESELAQLLSQELLQEINREVVRSIYYVAKIGAQNTSTVGTFDTLIDSTGRWSVEKFKGVMFQLELEANQIQRQTRQGRGNTIICSADLAAALSMAGLLDNATGLKGNNLNFDETQSTFAGVLNGHFKVYIDPHLPNLGAGSETLATVGYKGTSSYASGVIFSPYIAAQIQKAQDPRSFATNTMIYSRYAVSENIFARGDQALGRAGQLQANQNVYYRKLLIKNLEA